MVCAAASRAVTSVHLFPGMSPGQVSGLGICFEGCPCEGERGKDSSLMGSFSR